MQAQQRKIEHLEAELRETRAKLEESNAVQSEALQRHAEMQQEIENNAGRPLPEDLTLSGRLAAWGLPLQSAAAICSSDRQNTIVFVYCFIPQNPQAKI